jgi:aspartate/methionine/tyrosine aminotransferase
VPFGGDGGVATTFSFSKTYAMTGWRVAYLVAAREVAAGMLRLSLAAAREAIEEGIGGIGRAVREGSVKGLA